jgi:hypothetical protein
LNVEPVYFPISTKASEFLRSQTMNQLSTGEESQDPDQLARPPIIKSPEELEGDKQYLELAQKLQQQSKDEIELDKKAMKKRSNISNLPTDKLKQETKPEVRTAGKQVDLPLKPTANKPPVFDAWDDKDTSEFDVTTNQILAEKETFDILA